MAFHLEYTDHEGRAQRGNLLGDTLESAEDYAVQVLQREEALEQPIKNGEVYEGDPGLVGFGSGELRSTWDGEAWTRVSD